MHFRITLLLSIALCCVTSLPSNAEDTPDLVVFIAVDQLRGDMPGRMYDRFGVGGFRYLMDHGAFYSNAHYRHATTYTASGHATLVTGGNPAEHGFIGNSWYNRDYPGESFYALADTDHEVLNGSHGPGVGTSPRNLTSTTIGDELIAATNGAARVFSVSLKDRAAIAMGGRGGKAFWYDTKTGAFTSSTYYFKDAAALPDWVQAWNKKSLLGDLLDPSGMWNLFLNPIVYKQLEHDNRPYEKDPANMGIVFPHPLPSKSDPALFNAVRFTPYGDMLTVEFVKELLKHEELGRRGSTDFLAVSLSCTDYIGHAFGPESLEQEDNLIRLDRLLSELIDALDQMYGRENVLFVLSSDHGVDIIPEQRTEHNYHAGRVDTEVVQAELEPLLIAEFGADIRYIEMIEGAYIYLDEKALTEAGINISSVETFISVYCDNVDGIAEAVTHSDLSAGNLPKTAVNERVVRSFVPERFGNVMLIPDQFFSFTSGSPKYATTHGSPYTYDTYVPIMFAGPGIQPAQIKRAVGPEDIAPTLAAILGVMAPSGSTGTALHEVLGAQEP